MQGECETCGAPVTMHKIGTKNGRDIYHTEYTCGCKVAEMKRSIERIAHMENEKSPRRTDIVREF